MIEQHTMNQKNLSQKNMGSLVIATFFIFVAVITLYDTTSYSDLDSKVFPRACAIGMLFFSILTIIWSLLKPTEDEGFGNGLWWRRLLLISTMLVACAAMPYLGFLLAGSIAFIGGLIAGMHDSWSRRTALIYGGFGIIITVSFYSVFRYVLHVPLP